MKASHEPLADLAKRWRGLSKDNSIELAREIVRTAANWAAYRDEADGLEIGQWLVGNIDPTRPFAWYKRLAEAAKRVGPEIVRCCSPRAVLWLANNENVGDGFEELRSRLTTAHFKKNGKLVPLSYKQVMRVASEFVTPRPPSTEHGDLRAKLTLAEATIGKLRAQLRENGIEPCA